MTACSPAVTAFQRELVITRPALRVVTDALQRLAYGTDASFYRLLPQLVIDIDDEVDLQAVLAAARQHKVAITFRAAGTSLSGQSITDSVLVRLSDAWKGYRVLDDGLRFEALAGVRGGDANNYLKPYGRMLAPIPASIASATIGGIAINNASGMNSLDTYGALDSMRVVLADGSVLDSADAESRAAFASRRPDLLDTLRALSARLKANAPLAERILRKYQLKNTTGYNLRALLQKDDPIDMLTGLMIGSEGTLGFLSRITQHTIRLYPVSASALLLFPSVQQAGEAVTRLKLQQAPVAAAELIDSTALKAVANMSGMPAGLATLPAGTTALLVKIDADERNELAGRISRVSVVLDGIALLEPMQFTEDAVTIKQLWNVRRGVFPAVGATRPVGTTAIIEDVCFPVTRLTEALQDLRALLTEHGYRDSVIYGHALDGNMHFIFAQGFDTPSELHRYRHMMEAVVALVVGKYDGSLKAEHGTGRNMAPFVRTEWGDEAYAVMGEIKRAFDPDNLLNPGVLLNDDPDIYLKHLKPIPATDPLIDQCIECGFCERLCPSRSLTFTPRQRIVAAREREMQAAEPDWADQASFDYLADQTCAGCGLCETACPVGINAGGFIRALRHGKRADDSSAARFVAEHFAGVTSAAKMAFGLLDTSHRLVGTANMRAITSIVRKLSRNKLAQWTPAMPRAGRSVRALGATALTSTSATPTATPSQSQLAVVYFASCAARTMAPARGSAEQKTLPEVVQTLLNRAGYRVIIPECIESLCCGMPFQSKGFFAEADGKLGELRDAMAAASDNGKWPVLFDTSPCTMRVKEALEQRFTIYEPAEFVLAHVAPKLPLRQLPEKIALHITCSSRRMGLERALIDVATRCATEVMIPDQISCCGFAGDKGFTTPELNASALAGLRQQVRDCAAGYSTSRTCEIGLSHHSGIDYQSLLYLVERSSRPHVDAG